MKLLDFIVCDDIRNEVGEKLSFMGVFGDNITLQVQAGAPRPISFKVSAFFRFLIEDTDPIPDSFRILTSLGKKESAKFEGTIGVVGRPKLLGLALPPVVVAVTEPASLSFRVVLSANGRIILDDTPPYGVEVQVSEVTPARAPGKQA